MTALARFLKLAWLRRQHRQDIARLNELRVHLATIRGEEQFAIFAALDSARRLAAAEAQHPQQEKCRVV